MKSNEFDQTDRIIVDELVRDGRISYVELAEKVGISRVAVKDRINSLINKGVIENFTAVINSERFGQNISAFFEVDVEPMNLQAVAQNLADNPSVASIYQMTGPKHTAHARACGGFQDAGSFYQ